jgi:hypothetical protein
MLLGNQSWGAPEAHRFTTGTVSKYHYKSLTGLLLFRFNFSFYLQIWLFSSA